MSFSQFLSVTPARHILGPLWASTHPVPSPGISPLHTEILESYFSSSSICLFGHLSFVFLPESLSSRACLYLVLFSGHLGSEWALPTVSCQGYKLLLTCLSILCSLGANSCRTPGQRVYLYDFCFAEKKMETWRHDEGKVTPQMLEKYLCCSIGSKAHALHMTDIT